MTLYTKHVRGRSSRKKRVLQVIVDETLEKIPPDIFIIVREILYIELTI